MKVRRFFAALPGRLCLFLAAAVVLIFFSNDFGLVDIQKTAIVLAAGIDREGEGFSLTAQIAVPKGSDRTAGGTSSVEIEGKGETVPDCIRDIYGKTGWVPKLVFCDLVLLGESAAREDVFSCLDFFLRNEYVPNSCHLAVCEGSAKDLLSSQSAVDDTSALALSKLFSDAAQKSGYVMTTSLREFAEGYYGVSGSGYMPYLRALPQEGAQTETTGGQSGQKTGDASSGQTVYTAEETAVFSAGKLAAVLPREQTFALSLLHGSVYAGTFGADGETYVVLKEKGSAQADLAAPAVRFSLDVRLQLYGTRDASAPDAIAKSILSPAQRARAEALLRSYLAGLWEQTAAAGCDVLQLRTHIYRTSPADFPAWKDALFSLPLLSEVDVKSVS